MKRKPKMLKQETGKYYTDEEVVRMALAILEHKFGGRQKISVNSPALVRDYLRLMLTGKEYEVFVCIFLDAQNKVIALEELFRGTLAQTSVYPREVVKRALHHNAAALVCAHNHPSGVMEPSRADEVITATLKRALALIDVSVLDHFIVGSEGIMSFAERGIL